MEEKLICGACNYEYETTANFCPICGEPLTNLAKTFESKKNKNIQLRTLIKLTEKVNDQKTLAVINEFVNFIQNN